MSIRVHSQQLGQKRQVGYKAAEGTISWGRGGKAKARAKDEREQERATRREHLAQKVGRLLGL